MAKNLMIYIVIILLVFGISSSGIRFLKTFTYIEYPVSDENFNHHMERRHILKIYT